MFFMKKKEEKELTESIWSLTKLVKELRSKRYLQMAEHPKKIFLYSFLLGIARGVGFAIGVSIVFAFIIWLLSKMTVIPFLGDWISTLLNYVETIRVR